MVIINLIDSFEVVNRGIWGSVLSTDSQLKKLGIVSEYWGPYIKELPEELSNVNVKFYSKILLKDLKIFLSYDKSLCVIHTHCSWGYNNRLAYLLKKRNFKWIFSPHGTLEPWALSQKSFKKEIYLKMIGNFMLSKCDVIRSVSNTENVNLKYIFPANCIVTIPNGIEPILELNKISGQRKSILFMGRLHKKKGLEELVLGWIKSNLYNSLDFELLISGTDDGELTKIMNLIKKNKINNIYYLGHITGTMKEEVLNRSDFFILPSHSEGLPTSVLEAISYGCLTIISKGCNFDDLTNEYIIKVEPSPDSITIVLNSLPSLDNLAFKEKTNKAKSYVDFKYSLDNIAHLHLELINSLLIQYE
jgi:glycosyltransferase involved in cell wall biosynthesis